MIPKLHPQGAFDDQEEFVLVLVMMPDEITLDFDRLEVAVVHLADDARFPVIGEEIEFCFQVDRVHEFT